MKNLRTNFILFFVVLFTITGAVAKPKYVSGIETLSHSHQYIRDHDALTYWRISPYYISQRNETSCSLASATMVVNAARSNQPLAENEPLATQNGVLRRVKSDEWSNGVAADGQGVTLEQLSVFMAKALEAYGVHKFNIKVVHLKNDSKENQSILHTALMESEKTGRTFIVANFNEKFFAGATNEGHFAPVGAYDAQTRRVLIMDPYRKLYEPYWVPEKLFLESMATLDNEARAYRGYLLVAL